MEIIQALISPALCGLVLYGIRRYQKNTNRPAPVEESPKKQLIRSYYRSVS